MAEVLKWNIFLWLHSKTPRNTSCFCTVRNDTAQNPQMYAGHILKVWKKKKKKKPENAFCCGENNNWSLLKRFLEFFLWTGLFDRWCGNIQVCQVWQWFFIAHDTKNKVKRSRKHQVTIQFLIAYSIPKFLLLRSYKTLAKETEHKYGLQHRQGLVCLMWGSNHLEKVNYLLLNLCPINLHKLQFAGFNVL